ncbi:MAG TPA: hypothetical protein VES39_06160, partial [Rhodospirillales bacterium]|nr:hypothetical protein [Rhodospirillales bacterium]
MLLHRCAPPRRRIAGVFRAGTTSQGAGLASLGLVLPGRIGYEAADRNPGACRTAMSRWSVVPAFLLSLLPVLAFWWWQGRPVAVADAPSAQLPCASYAPYRDGQTPFDKGLVIPPEQIAADLAHLRPLTGCVRTYSTHQGLDAVPRIARDLGMTVMLGAWIGRERAKNEKELAAVIDLARRYPETVTTVIVGNEVLLRREQPPAELAAMIGRVRAAVPMPVTYADVWEFWEKHPEVADAVDFVTIHALPYWEDEPQAIDVAVPHVIDIWQRISAQFPGRRVFIGEAGWPSAGRMREGARPGPVEQARFVRELMIATDRNRIGINVIEAFDQPWKRRMEGTVGGHWGLLDADRRAKFALQGPVSNAPHWRTLFALSAAIAALLLLPAARRGRRLATLRWLGLALAAAAAGTLLAQGLNDGIDGSRMLWDWLVLALRVTAAAAAAVLVLEELAGEARPAPLPIAALLTAMRRRQRPAGPWRATALGAVRATVLFTAAASTLCLVFDPR